MKHTIHTCAALVLALVIAAIASGETTLKPPADLSRLTERQRVWHEASLSQRQQMSELIGEEGAARWAKNQGYEPVLDHNQKQFRQGVDQIWRTPDGRIVAIEAKGGTSALGQHKGFTQGSHDYAVQTAYDGIKSPSTTAQEKKALALILEASKEGKLETVVIHTEHHYGEPLSSKIKEGHHFPPDHPSAKNASKKAGQLLDDLHATIRSASSSSDDVAKRAAGELDEAVKGGALALKYVKPMAKVAGPLFLIIDLYGQGKEFLRVEEEYEQGRITHEERVNQHAQQAGGMAGGWAGAAAGAAGGAMAGAALGGAAGSVVPIIGNTIGATVGGVVGGIAGGIGGYRAGDAAGRVGADYVLEYSE